MKARFEVFEMVGMYEMNVENIERAKELCIEHSRDYAFYVLAIGTNAEHEIAVYADGPLEC